MYSVTFKSKNPINKKALEKAVKAAYKAQAADLNEELTKIEHPAEEALSMIRGGTFNEHLGQILHLILGEDGSRRQKIGGLKKEQKILKEAFAKDPALYGKFISSAEKNGIGVYDNDLASIGVTITPEVLKNCDKSYIMNSIMYSSLYSSQKRITDEAVKYIWTQHFKNPLKEMIKLVNAGGWEEDSTSYSAISSFPAEMSKYLKELSVSEIQEILDMGENLGINSPEPDEILKKAIQEKSKPAKK